VQELAKPASSASAVQAREERRKHRQEQRRRLGFMNRIARGGRTPEPVKSLFEAAVDGITGDAVPENVDWSHRKAMQGMLQKCGLRMVRDRASRVEAQDRALHEHCKLPIPDPGAARTSQFSWFAGYTWVNVSCPKCNQHLGWAYERLDYLAAKGEPYNPGMCKPEIASKLRSEAATGCTSMSGFADIRSDPNGGIQSDGLERLGESLQNAFAGIQTPIVDSLAA